MATTLTSSAEHNLETFYLVWLDGSVNSSAENIAAQHQLRASINHLKPFENAQQCEQYIRSVSADDRIVLIVSGRLGRDVVPNIHQLRQVTSIYIYCMNKEVNEEWSKNFIKVRGVHIRLNDLVAQIRSDQRERSHHKVDEPLAISIFSTNDDREQSTSELSGRFVHSLLLIDCLLRMKSVLTDRNELISLCEKQYEGNTDELNILHEFQRTYSPDKALLWYTKDCFLYRLLNKALRVHNIDLLYQFRFFIRDIRQQLEQHQCITPVRVYRGQMMSKDELRLLKDSIGKLISMNSFFSTSLNRDLALSFLDNCKSSDDLKKILFKIDADPRCIQSQPFAQITNTSHFRNENEILFSLNSIFRLESIHRGRNHVWVIRMTLCDDNNHDLKTIFEHMKKDFGGGDGQTNLLSFGNVLMTMGKYKEAERYYCRLSNELPENEIGMAQCFYALGNVALAKGDYDASLEWQKKSLEIKKRILEANDHRFAVSYNSIGNIYQQKGDYQQAIDYYEKALVIWRRAFGGNHPKVALCLNNLGTLYQTLENFPQALEYLQNALVIRQEHLPADHPQLGSSHNNYGEVLRSLGYYDLALEHYNLSLKISQKSLPSHHRHIAAALENIGLVYEDKNDLQQALPFYAQAATIYRRALTPTHPDVVRIEQYIESLTSQINSS